MYLFSHRVFDLDTGVDFHEIVAGILGSGRTRPVTDRALAVALYTNNAPYLLLLGSTKNSTVPALR